MPLFFVALMALSLALERPHVTRAVGGKTTLGDPAGATEAKIWLLAALVVVGLALVAAFAMLIGPRGVVPTAAAAIVIAVALLLPLGTWSRRHSERYRVGVDLIPPSAGSEDIYHRGEWEGTAKRTAEQLGAATIGIGVAAIAISVALGVRRRKPSPSVPPPPDVATGNPELSV
jgi:hypothetical protein